VKGLAHISLALNQLKFFNYFTWDWPSLWFLVTQEGGLYNLSIFPWLFTLHFIFLIQAIIFKFFFWKLRWFGWGWVSKWWMYILLVFMYISTMGWIHMLIYLIYCLMLVVLLLNYEFWNMLLVFKNSSLFCNWFLHKYIVIKRWLSCIW
jgi:hypothetical protein